MKKILVVDNDLMMLTFMSDLLECAEYQVLTAKDGLTALEILENCIPDIMFIDLVMPNISGEKLCGAIRRNPKCKNIYIIIITAIAAEQEINISEIGADACIAKGSFSKMSKHILGILAKLNKKTPRDMTNKIIGIEDVHSRAVVKELLFYKRHVEVMLDNISEGILELNINKKIIYANEFVHKLTGLSENELLGLYFYDLFEYPHKKKVEDLLDLIKNGPQKISEDSPVILKGKIVSMSLLPIIYKEHESIVIILNDITKSKKAEEEQRYMQERLQRFDKMNSLGELAGGVAHDLNNVLGSLIGYSELLLRKTDDSSPTIRYVLNIMNSGEKAAAIVQDLLTMARRNVYTEQVVNLNSIIKKYMVTPEYDKLCSFHNDVKIRTDLRSDLLNIMGSPVHLDKMIMNLVSNAAEAMPKGGIITITTDNQYLDRPIQGYDHISEGEYVGLSISDTGEGISASDMKLIFEPFYTKKIMGRSGTGLGLAVVWGTVKDHNGYINVCSEEKKGTTFTLYFPVTREEMPEDQVKLPKSEYMGKGESILIVDDIDSQRDIAVLMLSELNYKVAIVSSGEEAIEYLKTNRVDLIVLDMIMDPGIDGLDTYKRIIEIHPKQKVIIVSGFSETDRVSQALKLGAGAYVKKPYLMEKIGLAVRKELDK
ncbi:MAG: response regulator [Proteobacteria bacterium]|nr:response regulator [Pseudomonadota bacterium]